MDIIQGMNIVEEMFFSLLAGSEGVLPDGHEEDRCEEHGRGLTE